MNALMNITVRVQSAQAQREVAALEAEIKALKAQMGMASAAAGGLASRGVATSMAKWGSQFQWAGRQLMTNFTFPLVASGALITKWVLDNEAGMVRLQKVYGDAANGTALFMEQQEQLGEVMDLLSVKYATQRKDVLGIAGDWAAAGATGAELANGIETTLKTMVLGEMDAATATQALIAIQAQYGANSEGLIGIIEKLNATENSTGVTFSGLVEGMARSASAAREAGVDVDHLAAMIASMSPAAGSAAQAGNALKTIFSRLQSPTKEAREILGMMNIDIDAAGWKSLNTAEKIEQLATSYHELEGSADGMISAQAGIVDSVIASRWQVNKWGVLMRDVYSYVDGAADTNGYYGKTLDLLADQTLVTATAARELKAVLDSEPMAVKRAGVAIQNNLMKVVAQLMPQIMWLINAISALVAKFTSLDPGLQKVILGFLALLAVIGPPMALIGAFAVGVGRLGILFKELGAAFKWVITGFGLFGKASGGKAGKAVTDNQKIIASTQEVAAVEEAAAATTTSAWSAAWETIQGLFRGAATTMQASMTAVGTTWDVVMGAMGTSSAGASAASAAAWEAGSATITSVVAVAATAAASAWAVASEGMAAATAATVLAITGYFQTLVPVAATTGTEVALAFDTALNVGGAKAFGEFFAQALAWFVRIPQIGGVSGAMTAAAWGTAAGTGLATTTPLMIGAGTAAAEAINIGFVTLTPMATATAARAGVAAGSTFALTAGTGAVAGGRGLFAKIGAMFATFGGKLKTGIVRLGPTIGRAALSLGRFLTGPIGLAITAVITLLVVFKDQIGTILKRIGAQFQDATTPFGKAWVAVVNLFHRGLESVVRGFHMLPEGIQGALIAVVDMVKSAAMAVYGWFAWMRPEEHHSPSLIDSVTRGMAIVGDQFGLAAERVGKYAMQAYGYMKIWGEATRNFMDTYNAAVVAADRALIGSYIPGAVDDFDNLTASLVPLKAELLNISAAVDAQQVVVNALSTALKEANDAVAALQVTMDSLQATADAASAALDAAQASLDNYANAPLEGMRAMSDAMFENEMAQKQLQLQMMDWEDVHGSIDDVNSRMADLQGSIEALRGEANDLRASGAGSDILGPINDQIAQMDAAYQSMQDGLADGGITDLQKQLADLQRQGQRLDLENSLQFDPLTRQIEQASQAYKEMPFDEVIAGVNQQRTAVDELTAKYDEAKAAVDAQQVALDAANATARQAQAAYDVQAASLDNLKTAYDAVDQEIQAIEQSIQDVITAANGMEDALNRAKNGGKGGGGGELTPAGENFMGAAGGAFPDVGDANVIGGEGGDLQGWLDGFMADNAKLFDGMDIFGGIKKAWANVVSWWNSNVTPIWTNLVNGFHQIFDGISWEIPDWLQALFDLFGPQLQNVWANIQSAWNPAMDSIAERLGPLWAKIQSFAESLGAFFSELWTVLKPVLAFIAVELVRGISMAFRIIANIIGPIIDWIGHMIAGVIQVIGGIISVITGIINFIVGAVQVFIGFFKGLFTGDWSGMIAGFQRMWDGIKQFATGITSIIGALWSALVETFKGAVAVVWGIIAGMVQGIVDWFVWLGATVGGKVEEFINGIIDWFYHLWEVLVGHSIIPDMVNAIIEWFKTLWTNVKSWVSNLVTDVVTFFSDLYTKVTTKVGEIVGNVVNWFAGLPGKILGAIGNLASTLATKGGELVGGFLSGAQTAWVNVTSWVGGIGGNILSAVGSLTRTLFDAGKNLIGGLLDGIKDKFEDAKNFVLGIGPWIKDHKGPEAYDKALLKPAGGHIMDGLGVGLANGFKDVQNQVRAMGPSLEGAFDVPTNNLGASLTSATNRLASATRSAAGQTVQHNETTIINLNGNLEFPNIKSGDDAGEFLRNLNDLAGA